MVCNVLINVGIAPRGEVFNDVEEFKLAINDANYGMHIGFLIQAKMNKFFIQPEFLFNSNSVNYKVEDFSGDQIITTIKEEKFNYLDIPIMVGYRLGPLRLQGGPVAHVLINSSSELFDLEGYDQKFDETTWGYQAGVGLDIWRFIFDLKYEGNFNKFGDHINFFGDQYTFDKSPGRWIASVGFTF